MVHSLSSLSRSGGSSLRESPYFVATPRWCSTRTGKYCGGHIYNCNSELNVSRNPFNDDLIASCSDDGKVWLPGPVGIVTVLTSSPLDLPLACS